LLSQFEETRNEQGREIEKLEKENNQLDQDLNQAVDLLEAKDKTISKLANQNQELTKELQTKKSAINKTFFCDSCQLTKQGEYIKRKVDAPF
jgi:chromosome segregation ATPase